MGKKRIHIPELAQVMARSTREDFELLSSAGLPFTMRPIVPEDLGTIRAKGRDDLVAIKTAGGATKMTRTLAAELCQVRRGAKRT